MKLWLVISRNRRQKFLHVCINTCRGRASEKEILCVWAWCVPVSYWLGCAADTVKNKAPSTLTRCDTKGEGKPCVLLCHAGGRKQQIVLEGLQKVNLTLVPIHKPDIKEHSIAIPVLASVLESWGSFSHTIKLHWKMSFGWSWGQREQCTAGPGEWHLGINKSLIYLALFDTQLTMQTSIYISTVTDSWLLRTHRMLREAEEKPKILPMEVKFSSNNVNKSNYREIILSIPPKIPTLKVGKNMPFASTD